LRNRMAGSRAAGAAPLSADPALTIRPTAGKRVTTMDTKVTGRRSIAAMAVLILMAAAVALAGENRGAAELSLDGGKRGAVPFPHRRHQDVLNDCQLCHSVFPQQPGAIQALKAQGALKPKQVMNKQCIHCHKAKKKAGETTGPLTCSKCHQR
jgi:hypothetical protein